MVNGVPHAFCLSEWAKATYGIRYSYIQSADLASASSHQLENTQSSSQRSSPIGSTRRSRLRHQEHRSSRLSSLRSRCSERPSVPMNSAPLRALPQSRYGFPSAVLHC
jgi:hypothetical protein